MEWMNRIHDKGEYKMSRVRTAIRKTRLNWKAFHCARIATTIAGTSARAASIPILRPAAFLLAVLIAVVAVPLPAAAADDFAIERYDVEMEVTDSNVYSITETILANFAVERHGIYRDIPLTQYGYNHSIEEIRATDPDTGETLPTEITRSTSMLRLRIGDPDTTVTGEKSYRIHYLYDASNDLNRNADEIYFNLIGTGWEAAISEVHIRVDMPQDFDAADLHFYRGTFGSTDSEGLDWSVDGRTIEAVTTAPLASKEGVTMRLTLPQGYWSDVSDPFNFAPLTAVMAVYIAAAVLLAVRRSRVSNAAAIETVPTERPPAGLNPAEVAYVRNEESLSRKEMASIILDWASRGLLRIDEDGEKVLGLFENRTLTFTRLGDLPPEAPAYERTLFQSFFSPGGGASVTSHQLRNRLYQDLDRAVSGVSKAFSGEREILDNGEQNRTRLGRFLLFLSTTLTMALAANLAANGGVFVTSALVGGGLLLFSWVIAYGIGKWIGKSRRKSLSGCLPYVVGGFIALVFALIAIGILSERIALMLRPDMAPLAIVLVLHAFIARTLTKTKVYTPFALQVMGGVRGFSDFLSTADDDRLSELAAGQPSYFMEILPYAMALNLTRVFSGTLERLCVAPPVWYHSHRGFSPRLFMDDMDSVMSTAVSQPSSSGGSGGGGSSGGGGGGGGGGSW